MGFGTGRAGLRALLAIGALASVALGAAPYERVNEPPVKPAFIPLPPGAMAPTGWLRGWTEVVKTNFISTLGERDTFFRDGWTVVGRNWYQYEQSGYWADGLIRLGHALGDSALVRKGMAHVEAWMTHQPAKNLTPLYGFSPWTFNVLSRAMLAQYQATSDPRLLASFNKAFANYAYTAENIMQKTNAWCINERRIPAAEGMLEAYSFGGDKALLDNALKMLSVNEPNMVEHWGVKKNFHCIIGRHGVTFNEEAKVYAIGYPWTGKPAYLDASVNAYEHIQEITRPYGLHSAAENIAGLNWCISTEICDITDFIWSNIWLLRVTGDRKYGDRIERAFYNAAPASFSTDSRNHVYYQDLNRIADSARPPDRTTFLPKHDPLCCTGNLCRILPIYANHQWMATYDNGIALTLHGPGAVKAKVGAPAREVAVECRTEYPFDDRLTLHVGTAGGVDFPLHIRVPEWCESPQFSVNGAPVAPPIGAKGFARLQRVWNSGDTVTVRFPRRVSIRHGACGGTFGTVSLGPLLFAYAPQTLSDNRIVPNQHYGFGLLTKVLDSLPPLVKRTPVAPGWGFTVANSPIRISMPMARLKGSYSKPRLFNASEVTGIERVDLVPYGAAKIRIAGFATGDSIARDLPVSARVEARSAFGASLRLRSGSLLIQASAETPWSLRVLDLKGRTLLVRKGRGPATVALKDSRPHTALLAVETRSGSRTVSRVFNLLP